MGWYIQSDPRGVTIDFSDPKRMVAAEVGVATYARSEINHMYNYAHQSSLNNVDPSGESWIAAGSLIGAALVATVYAYDKWNCFCESKYPNYQDPLHNDYRDVRICRNQWISGSLQMLGAMSFSAGGLNPSPDTSCNDEDGC